jgi:hypothetical protein
LGIESNKAYPKKMHELIKPTAAITFKRSIVLTYEGRPNEYSEPKNSLAFGLVNILAGLLNMPMETLKWAYSTPRCDEE